jgi:hypothetical protein
MRPWRCQQFGDRLPRHRFQRQFSGTLGHLCSASHPMPHSFKPTHEQHAVVDAVLGGGDLKIKAYAGAGKTSTLRLVGDRLAGRRCSYLASTRKSPSTLAAAFRHQRAHGAFARVCVRISGPDRARESPGRTAARIGRPLWARLDSGAHPLPAKPSKSRRSSWVEWSPTAWAGFAARRSCGRRLRTSLSMKRFMTRLPTGCANRCFLA